MLIMLVPGFVAVVGFSEVLCFLHGMDRQDRCYFFHDDSCIS